MPPTRVLICGSRNWSDPVMIRQDLGALPWRQGHPVVVIHGDCRGADKIADEWARLLHYQVEVYRAQWQKHGRSAGPIRNRQMLDEGLPDEVWAYHDSLESSRGTKGMVGLARERGIPVRVRSHAAAPA